MARRPSRRALLALGAGSVLGLGNAAPAAAGWLGDEVVRGNGSVRTSRTEPGRFTGIALAVPGTLEVQSGAQESVSVEADDNLLPLISLSVVQGVLHIQPVRRDLRLEPTQLRLRVVLRQLERLSVAGSGSAVVPRTSGGSLKVEVGGAGTVRLQQLEVGAVSLAVGGAGRIDAAGTAGSLSVSIGGAGDIRAAALRAAQVSVNVAGAGDARVWATERLDIALAGAGEVGYYGAARVSQAVVGIGRVKHLGNAPPA